MCTMNSEKYNAVSRLNKIYMCPLTYNGSQIETYPFVDEIKFALNGQMG